MKSKELPTLNKHKPIQLLEQIDFYRTFASQKLDADQKSSMGQFMTPAPIANFMASLFNVKKGDNIRLLDPGAGVGSLTAAFVEEFSKRPSKANKIVVYTFETDPLLFDYLNSTLLECEKVTSAHGVKFGYDMLRQDFISYAYHELQNQLFSKEQKERYTHVIMNPPYRKIRSDSRYRSMLSSVGIETSNLYTGFLALAIKLIKPGGELVAITPRSFCNGPYFKTFRKLLLNEMFFQDIHIFEARDRAFTEENVLQENIIFHAIKGACPKETCISTSIGPDFKHKSIRRVKHDQIVNPEDPNLVIHLSTNEFDQYVLERIDCYKHSLDDLGINVSTGKVVDFRADEYMRKNPENNTVPLIYPAHFEDNIIRWPKDNIRKSNAFIHNQETKSFLLPEGYYVTVKRFSPKEEYHRISPALYDPTIIKSPYVAFENHLNVFHCHNRGLPKSIAKGLVIYLNSSLLDIYFRHFNGHTQVNATDLRMIRYPSRQILEKWGCQFFDSFPEQDKIDELLENEVHRMAKINSPDPVKAKNKIDQALKILKALGFPRAQQNERSALTLLALVHLKPETKWEKGKAHLIGITPIMNFCKEYYGRNYAPNTRETFRRQTMHQFVAAGLAIENPDKPERPINSPKWCYQIETNALTLIKTFGKKEWKQNLKNYLENVGSLRKRYARERKMEMIPVTFSDGKKISLTPGKHNELIRDIIVEFSPRFAPGGKVIYVGETGDKWVYFDDEELKELGIVAESRGKMPDVVIYYPKKDWIILIEAVTSHGPVDGKRREELSNLFSCVKEKLVYVTAFPNRSIMTSYLGVISWETEVWIAEAPTHLIHFNGIQFLSPYNS
jgi:adenine-specific DNA-methyltransferase